MGVRITLNSILLSDTPRGWDDAEITSKRDETVKGLFTTYTTDLEFWGDGFTLLDDLLNGDYCQTVDVLIETDDCQSGSWEEEFVGIIQLTQISKYDVDQRIISTKILDASFEAKIDNNKSIKAFVDVGLSKNAENIEAVSPVTVRLFDPNDAFNIYAGSAAEGWRIFDCFRFIIDYMTDGQVGFKSDLLSGTYYNWVLLNGKELRVGAGNGNQLEVSFKELFLEVYKKLNISFAIEPTPSGYDNQYQLRLEETSFFEKDDAILTLSDIRGIDMDFNKNELYSNVEIGSDNFDDDVVLSYPPLNFKAFKEEDYTILGQCNIDKTLNLVSKYIIDTNVIEDVRVNGATKYDDKTFIIVIDDSGNAIKYKEYDEPVASGIDDAGTANRLTDSTADFNADGVVSGDMAVNMLTGLTANINSVDAGGTFCLLDADIYNNGDGYQIRDRPFNYNDPLTNINVIGRFLGGLPNSVIKHISGSESASFRAGITTQVKDISYPVVINPVEYDDDSTFPFFDKGSNYDNTTFEYTVPSSGLYGLEAKALIVLRGIIGVDEMSNGDFSSGATDWFLTVGNIGGGQFTISATSSLANIAYLKQAVLTSNFIYELEFTCSITSGSISVIDGSTVTTSGTHKMILDFSTQAPSSGYLEFKFGVGSDGNAISSISEVIIKKTPRFTVTQTIQRSSTGGTLLQSFPQTFDIIFPSGVFQIQETLIAQKTFSTFSGEKIDVRIDIVNNSGLSPSSSILTDYLNQDTFETEYTEFKTVLVDDGGGDILPVEPTTFPIYKYSFDKGMTFSDFKLLVNNPAKALLFSKNKLNHIFSWRNTIKYKRKTGETEFNVRSKTKINGDC